MEFSSLNGYDVKDKVAREQTQSIINDKVKYIFPKFWSNSNSGDISLIQYKEKNIVIDTHLNDMWNNVKNMLDDNNVSHIDYLIITHYDSDHVGNFKNLFDYNYIDSDTNFYMPSEVTNFGTEITDLIDEYKTYFQANNLNYYVPTENEELTIDDLVLKFYNCNSTILDSLYTDYNDTSTVVLFTFRKNQSLFVGDCGQTAYKRLSDDNFIKSQIDLFKVGHHGINIPTYDKFINDIQPKYSVVIGGINDFAKGNISFSNEVTKLRELNSLIYCSFMEENYIEFESSIFNTICKNGKPFGTSNNNGGITLYVDINTTNDNIQNGSETKPFKEILQALGSIDFRKISAVHINLADGTYSSSFVSIVGTKNSAQIIDTKNVEVEINGNSSDKTAVTINTANVVNGTVIFNNLTIKGDNTIALQSRNSNIILNNVNIISNSEGTKYDGIVLRENSYLSGQSVSFNNLARGLILRTGSNMTLYNTTFGTITGNVIEKDNECISLLNNTTFTDESKLLPFKLSQSIHIDDDIVYNNNSGTHQGITLKRQTNYYDWIKIDYQDNEGVKGTTGKIATGSNNTQIIKIPGIIQKLLDSNIVISQVTFQIQGQYVSFSDNRQTTITSSGTVSVTEESTYINITKITCGMNYEISKI